MIPKIIHYCWVGGNPLPESALKCIESWKKYCPNYEIKEWNESNIDIFNNNYMREAYEEKNWGFVPDVARLQIIYNNGGIYLDTDVEIIKSFDDLLDNEAFIGFESSKHVNLGLGFGAEKNNAVIKSLLEEYENLHFRNADGTLNRTPSPVIQTKTLVKLGLQQKNMFQNILGARIYPQEYFNPITYKTGICKITKNTYSIHHYDGSWNTEEEKKLLELRYKTIEKYGVHFGEVVWKISRGIESIRKIGFKNTVVFIIKKFLKE